MRAVEPVDTEESQDDGRAWAEEDNKPKPVLFIGQLEEGPN